MHNTRIAPSPTGDMHIGTARTAYFNWLAAKSSGGKFHLRIDDTDKSRSKDEFVDVIMDTLAWLGLHYDELIFQSSRADRHRQVAQDFIQRGLAVEKDGCVQLVKPNPKAQLWHDDALGSDVPITEDDIKDSDEMVLIKSDGSPTYNWSSVIDDMDLGINFIIRGTDHITNTAKQIILWELLNAQIPRFAHVGLICVKGKPLSKRDGAASMLHYRNSGYDPDAMLNFLARLGWGPRVDDKTTKLLPKEKMLELFLTGGSMRSYMSNIDMDKLEAFDRKYKAAKGIWRNKDRLDAQL